MNFYKIIKIIPQDIFSNNEYDCDIHCVLVGEVPDSKLAPDANIDDIILVNDDELIYKGMRYDLIYRYIDNNTIANNDHKLYLVFIDPNKCQIIPTEYYLHMTIMGYILTQDSQYIMRQIIPNLKKSI